MIVDAIKAIDNPDQCRQPDSQPLKRGIVQMPVRSVAGKAHATANADQDDDDLGDHEMR
ncbi:MAG: hypothetical protein P4L33_20950 [Capsulimonadaceae bacterium]|nr:hypothetical protein [Capsulimonadaceae bacterium]